MLDENVDMPLAVLTGRSTAVRRRLESNERILVRRFDRRGQNICAAAFSCRHYRYFALIDAATFETCEFLSACFTLVQGRLICHADLQYSIYEPPFPRTLRFLSSSSNRGEEDVRRSGMHRNT